MTKNTCTRKITVLVFFIFVSSFSPVVAPKNKTSSSDNPTTLLRSLKGSVHVKLPQMFPTPKSIAVLLKGDLDFPRTFAVQWYQCHENKCNYQFEFSAGIKQYTLQVKLFYVVGNSLYGKKKQKEATLGEKIHLPSNEAVRKNIMFDLTKEEEPKVSLE
ncbi:hypothetical protein Ddc_21832 [Ditylenchus destructor]|nr:hypothetical protein Ddc_21832 [Ditylenchus destructor]